MVPNLVNLDYDFFEVLNAFPILKKTLLDLDFSLRDVKEGESVHDYFEKKSLSEDEISIVVRKLNQKLNSFFKSYDGIVTDDLDLEMIKAQEIEVIDSQFDEDELKSEEE